MDLIGKNQALGDTKIKTVAGGKETVKGAAQILEEELILADKTGDTVKKKNLDGGISNDKAAYRAFLYKCQEVFGLRITQKQHDLQNAGPKEREKILQEARELGAFQRALEEELKFIRNH